MLVLSRKIGERLMIGNNITVVVNKIGTKRVEIGIEAPAEVLVRRAELRKHEGGSDAKPDAA